MMHLVFSRRNKVLIFYKLYSWGCGHDSVVELLHSVYMALLSFPNTTLHTLTDKDTSILQFEKLLSSCCLRLFPRSTFLLFCFNSKKFWKHGLNMINFLSLRKICFWFILVLGRKQQLRLWESIQGFCLGLILYYSWLIN